VTPWKTRAEDVVVHGSGWLCLPSGVEVTRLPLVDGSTTEPLFARLTYRDAIAVAARLGGRLPTRAEVIACIQAARAGGLVCKPVTLSYGPEMIERPHAVQHDERVKAMLTGWDGWVPVCGVGKHWVAGAAPGKSRLCGWWNGIQLIQSGLTDVHDDLHHDYASLTLVVR
jgi:hypothetical protein